MGKVKGGNFTILTIRETAGQDQSIPASRREHFVRAHDSQNGKTLWVTESYANHASAVRAAKRLTDRHNGGAVVFVP